MLLRPGRAHSAGQLPMHRPGFGKRKTDIELGPFHFILAKLSWAKLACAVRGSRPAVMLIHLLKSKIHRARVTAADVNYEGSLGIDEDLMDRVGLRAHERILCSDLANGHRWETYAIPAERGSGAIILNGAVAHLGKKGDRITIMSFAAVDAKQAKKWQPAVIVLGARNAVVNERGL